MFCIPIIAKNTEDALKKMAEATPLADIIEIRLDMMESFDIGQIVRSSVKPVLVTYRSEREGGMGTAGPDTAADYLISAIQEGAELVDLELSMPQRLRDKILSSRDNTEVIISSHIYDGTPSRQELKRILNDCINAGGDIIKIVTMARRLDDNLRVLELIPQARDMDLEIIAFCMGPLGRMSRLFSLLMGANMTFASLAMGQESAEGQIPVDQIKELLKFFTP
jgi:3-dehydroquinate dehydratase type I